MTMAAHLALLEATAAYLAAGGTITKVPPNASGLNPDERLQWYRWNSDGINRQKDMTPKPVNARVCDKPVAVDRVRFSF